MLALLYSDRLTWTPPFQMLALLTLSGTALRFSHRVIERSWLAVRTSPSAGQITPSVNGVDHRRMDGLHSVDLRDTDGHRLHPNIT